MRKPAPLLLLVMVLLLPTGAARCWSNGGYSSDPSKPDYGTHDWIAEHALDYLPASEKKFLVDNLRAYLYGTELPDNGAPIDGIGDTSLHHIYYRQNGILQDAAAAERAKSEYEKALFLLCSGDGAGAAKHAGIMAHYISDVASFGHVMGVSTGWGGERHHSEYEDKVNDHTSTYASDFTSGLSFDGSLTPTAPEDATRQIAYDITFDRGGTYTASWMDANYDWGNAAFKKRALQSLNLAVNMVADVLHKLAAEATPKGRLRVKVTAEGKPLSGATVRSISQPANQIPFTMITDDLGEALNNNVAAGRYDILVEAAGFKPATLGVTVELTEQTSKVELTRSSGLPENTILILGGLLLLFLAVIYVIRK